MRHLGSVALCLLVLLLPAYAQRGGRGGGAVASRGGGGFRGSAPMAFHGGGSFQGAPRSSYPVRTQIPQRPWGGQGYLGLGYGNGYGYGYYGHGHGYYPHYHYPYYPSYGYGVGYVYPYAYMGYPYFDNGFYATYYSSDQNSDYYAQQTAQLNSEIGSLNQQMQDLRDQNDNLRDYIERSDAAAAARTQPAPAAPQSLQQPMQAETPAPPTVLVFKDGHTAEVHNYAVVGDTLWALTDRRSQKYPLADLDINKTVQENERRGVEFTAPPQK